MLELARQANTKAPIVFAAFTLEEPPACLTGHQGSRIFVRACQSDGPRVLGAIILEMVGYTAPRQNYPFTRWPAYPAEKKTTTSPATQSTRLTLLSWPGSSKTWGSPLQNFLRDCERRARCTGALSAPKVAPEMLLSTCDNFGLSARRTNTASKAPKTSVLAGDAQRADGTSIKGLK
jgi:hypothetical protein